jgi:hypothetical protein
MKKILTVIIIFWTNSIFGQKLQQDEWDYRFDQIKYLYQNYEMDKVDGIEIFISDSVSTIHYGGLIIKNKSGKTWIAKTIKNDGAYIQGMTENAYIMATSKLFQSLRPKVKKKIKTQTGEAYTMRSPFFIWL